MLSGRGWQRVQVGMSQPDCILSKAPTDYRPAFLAASDTVRGASACFALTVVSSLFFCRVYLPFVRLTSVPISSASTALVLYSCETIDINCITIIRLQVCRLEMAKAVNL